MTTATARRAAAPPTAPDPAESRTGPARALRIVASVVANTTLLTALLYFFGLVATQVFFDHFRVHYTLLGQTSDEILARGADGLFMPLAGTAIAVLAGTFLARYLRSRLSARRWAALLRVCAPVAAVLGLVLLAVTVPITVDPEPFHGYPGLPGLGFALGIVLLAFAWRRWSVTGGRGRKGAGFGVVESVAAFLLASIGLFWAVGDYSASVGTRRGFEVEARIPDMPAVVVYSAESLNLTGGGVRQVACGQSGAAYQYRYDGLKLLLQSGGQYVFVPATWRTSSGTAFVVPRTDSLRLEFGPPGSTPPPSC
ncbi:hypothetical protein [Saccharothrix texasensis]|uniref:Uncharacterized protein n=1 Tax=Saccharothrix texasensis TaxID=103734 RepID=A0A3N1GY55_9PSEU|nr:hypothetical protein [Saccharothrix texasensis]ROP35205.1 hypothetical protein EDD40_0426 [Saccharothrix texasensis]